MYRKGETRARAAKVCLRTTLVEKVLIFQLEQPKCIFRVAHLARIGVPVGTCKMTWRRLEEASAEQVVCGGFRVACKWIGPKPQSTVNLGSFKMGLVTG